MQENPKNLDDKEWKKILAPESFKILRLKGTEAPFTGKYWDSEEKGTYYCAGCGAKLFDSNTKFKSGCGWPSFTAPFDIDSVDYKSDNSFGMDRIEVLCKQCGGHLGHIFNDGPAPTGKRYCINSAALKFKKKGI